MVRWVSSSPPDTMRASSGGLSSMSQKVSLRTVKASTAQAMASDTKAFSCQSRPTISCATPVNFCLAVFFPNPQLWPVCWVLGMSEAGTVCLHSGALLQFSCCSPQSNAKVLGFWIRAFFSTGPLAQWRLTACACNVVTRTTSDSCAPKSVSSLCQTVLH